MLVSTTDLILYLLLFSLGSALTSFFCAQIYRIENGVKLKDFFTKGSYCESCGKALGWYELIPVWSYLLTRGKCNECGYRIPRSYAIFETLLGLAFIALYVAGAPLSAYLLSSFIYFLAIYDYYHMGVPKFMMQAFLLIAGLIALVQLLSGNNTDNYAIVIGAIMILAFMLLNRLKPSFGSADLMVFAGLALLLPKIEFISTVMLAIVTGGLAGILLISLGRATRKSRIPFIPFIYFGLLLAFIFNSEIYSYFANVTALW